MAGSFLRRSFSGAALLGILFIAAPLFAQVGALSGSVTGEKGEVLVGYPILIERIEIRGIYKTKTDKKGNYVYIGLAPGNYKVTLQDPNGRTLFFFNNRHVGIGDPTVVDFDLAKEKALAQKDQQANPQFQKQMEEQVKEQKQLSGLKGVFDEGQALYGEKKYAEAAMKFEQALPLASGKNVPIVLGRLADSYRDARQYDKAIESYQKAIQASPTNSQYHNNLGDTYARAGKVAEAQAEFQKAAEIDPAGASRYYYNLGAIMYNQGKMDEASAAFKKATELDSNFADAYFMEGRALMGKLDMDPKTGKVIAAPGTAEALQTYLKLEPTGKFAADAQQMLLTIQGGVQTEFKVEKKKKRT